MIIEKLTGEETGKWMQKNLLEPAGCVDMHLAHIIIKQVSQRGVICRTMTLCPNTPIPRQAALPWRQQCGGFVRRRRWVASTPELARFVASINGHPGVQTY